MVQEKRLKLTLPSERELVMIRSFDAPRELVFDALTKPEMLEQWFYGPDDHRLAVCEIDLRVGGAFRYVWFLGDGSKMGMGGVYREVTPPERLVHTELFDEDWTGGETLVTTVLSEEAGVTTLAMTVLYSSREARDGALKTPMEDGAVLTFDRLEEYLGSLGG